MRFSLLHGCLTCSYPPPLPNTQTSTHMHVFTSDGCRTGNCKGSARCKAFAHTAARYTNLNSRTQAQAPRFNLSLARNIFLLGLARLPLKRKRTQTKMCSKPNTHAPIVDEGSPTRLMLSSTSSPSTREYLLTSNPIGFTIQWSPEPKLLQEPQKKRGSFVSKTASSATFAARGLEITLHTRNTSSY